MDPGHARLLLQIHEIVAQGLQAVLQVNSLVRREGLVQADEQLRDPGAKLPAGRT